MIRRVAASTLVLSAIALASLPLSAARVPCPPQDGGPFIQDEPRAMTRVAYFNQAGLQGEYLIQYGKPAWKPEYDSKWDELTRGKRVRLGRDWWTTLSSFCPLTLSEKVELKPGEYLLALDCSEKGDWSLVALDPEPLRKQRIDAFASEQTKGGTKAALKHEDAKESAAELSIRFLADEKDKRLQTLEIRFGRHRLTTTVQPKL